jgi:hypothetical protein
VDLLLSKGVVDSHSLHKVSHSFSKVVPSERTSIATGVAIVDNTGNRHSLFALNRRYAELHIMDVKLGCDLFNTLVHSTASYACEVWVDSKKIKAIEVMYWKFLKSLLRVWTTTSTSIVLAKIGKFPFEYFAWGQTLLYYNRVSMVTNDRILGKAWEAQFVILVVGKKCWAKSVKKWLFQNQS